MNLEAAWLDRILHATNSFFFFFYAASDELHQKFVDGRSAEIRDVCIDTCGVILGILLVILAGKIIKNIKKKKAEKLDTKS